jgi:glycine cleavage system aminomethyltransferase T
MRGIYVVFCNEDGSLKDDAILHKYSEHDYLLLPSDIDHSAYFDDRLAKFYIHDVTIIDCTHSMVGFALQGPCSAAVMSQMGLDGIEHLPPFVIQDFPLAEGTIRVSRMGFTADLGYECWIQPDLRPAIEARIQQARENLGLAIPGYGHFLMQEAPGELNDALIEAVTALEAVN